MTTLYRFTKRLSTFKAFFLLACGLLFAGTSFAALSGSYSIDKGGTASATVYKSFSDLVSDLESGTRSDGGTANGPGVSGAVTVTVVASSGPYTEQINISAITGASSTNTITIDGNGEAIQYTATSSSSSYTIRLTGADYFIFQNLTVRALGTSYGRCFHLMSSADNNVIQNCTLEMTNMGSSSNYNGYVMLTNGTSSPNSSLGAPGQNNVIKNNTTSSGSSRGPYYGMAAFNSSSTSVIQRNTWEGNTIRDFYYYGLYCYYTIDQTIINNEITNQGNLNSGTKYAMYMYNYFKGGGHTITGNYIHDLGTVTGTSYHYGLYLYGYYGTGSDDLLVKDNRIVLVHPYYSYGMYFYMYYSGMSGTIDILNNYIEMEAGGSYNVYEYPIYFYAYYLNSVPNVNIMNNEIWCHSYGAYGMYNLAGYGAANVNIINNKINLWVEYYVYGMYNYAYGSSGKWSVSYNTVNISPRYSSTTGGGYTYGIFLYYMDGGEAYNNNIYTDLDNNGIYAFYEYHISSAPAFDYNNVHIEDATFGQKYYAVWNGNTVSTFAALVSNTGGTNCTNINPQFADPANNDLTPQSFEFVNLGRPVSGITTDYRGITRSTTTPDIGCYEFFLDVSFDTIKMVGGAECGGYKEPVTVVITNNNNIDIKNIPVQYAVNGGTPVKEMITDVIGPAKTYTYTFTKVPEFNGTATHTVEVSLGGVDDDASNNSLTYVLTTIESPFGASISADPLTFAGYYQLGAQGGIKTNPDVTVPGEEIVYTINNPTKFPNAQFGTSWDLTALHMTSGGVTIGSSMLTYTAPSSGGNGSIAFDPDPSLVDSLVFIGYAATDINTGCDSIFGRWVYIPHYPTPDYDFTDVCDGEVVAFTDKSTMDEGLIVYNWNFDDPNSGESNTSEISDAVHLFSSYGSYNVTLTTWNFDYPKFTYTMTKTVNVNPVPEIAFKVKNACEGVDITFQNQTVLPGGLTGTIDYTWDFADGSPTSNLENPTHQFSDAGGYKVTLTADYNGCAISLTKNANQFARPAADFTVDGNCNLEETQFNNNTTIELGKTGYSWDFGDGDVSNLENPTHAFADFGSHTVTLTAISEFGCDHQKQVTFTLNESPKADFTYTDPCNLSDIDFTRTGSTPAGNSIYEWDFDGEFTSTQENPSYRFENIGVRNVSLKVSSDNGCSDMISKDIIVKLQARADFTATDVCDGKEAVFTNKSSVAKGELTYLWRFGDQETSLLTSPRHQYTLLDPDQTETFNVTLVANVLGGCADSITRTVTVNALANASFDAETQGRELVITNQVTTNPSYIYNWRFGDGARSSDVTPTYTYSADVDNFEVCLAIINDAGCLSEHCETVMVDLVGVEELNLDNNMVQVFPNPGQGLFNVKVRNPENNIKITVMSITGETLDVVQPAAADGSYTINLENAAEGIYLLQVQNGDAYAVKRITVAR